MSKLSDRDLNTDRENDPVVIPVTRDIHSKLVAVASLFGQGQSILSDLNDLFDGSPGHPAEALIKDVFEQALGAYGSVLDVVSSTRPTHSKRVKT